MRRPQSPWLYTTLLPLLLVASMAHSAPGRGERLHSGKCVSCHAQRFADGGEAIYTRPNRRVTSFERLGKQTRWCVSNLGITWFDDEVADVVDYLNRTFYHFNNE